MLFSAFLCETKATTCNPDFAPHEGNHHTMWYSWDTSASCDGNGNMISESLLVVDDRVLCEEHSHANLQHVSAVCILLFAFGVPTGFTVLLVLKARSAKKPSIEQILQAEKDLLCTHEQATSVVQDVQLGNSFSFLVDAYKSRFHYWEMIDLYRKLLLVGAVVAFGRGSVLQLLAAIIFSFGFFTGQMACRPMKHDMDNMLRASCECHIFLTIGETILLPHSAVLMFIELMSLSVLCGVCVWCVCISCGNGSQGRCKCVGDRPQTHR